MDKPRQPKTSRCLRAFLLTEGAPENPLLRSILSEHGCDVVTPSSALQALESLQRSAPDLVVLDNVAPGSGAVGVVHHLRDINALGATVPVVAITREGTAQSDQRELLGSGIWDVLSNPWEERELSLKLTNFLQARRAYLDERDMSLLDSVTGLYSRKGMDTRASELAGQCARQGVLLSCVAFSLAVNGGVSSAPITDYHLAEIGSELRRVGRAADAIGHANGGDFVILAPGVNGSNARLLANRITNSVTSLLGARGVSCDAPWVGRLLQPSRGGERLGEELLSDTLLALQEVTAEHEIPVSG